MIYRFAAPLSSSLILILNNGRNGDIPVEKTYEAAVSVEKFFPFVRAFELSREHQ